MMYHALLKRIGNGENAEDPDEDFLDDLYDEIINHDPNSLERAYTEMVKIPLSKENISLEFIKAGTPFPFIVGLGDLELAKIMISKGVDVNIMVSNYKALQTACFRGDVEMAKLLLQNGAGVNDYDGVDQTPLSALFLSMGTQKTEIIDVNVCYQMTQLLVSYGAKISRSNGKVIQDAIGCADLRTLMLLVDEANGDISFRTSQGNSCLHSAVDSYKPGVLPYVIGAFLRRNLDLNPQNRWNETPLMRASHPAIQNHSAVKMLLKFGADFSIKNDKGLTSFDLLTKGERNPELAWLHFDLGLDILGCMVASLEEAMKSESFWAQDIIAEIAKQEMMGGRVIGINQQVFNLNREARSHRRLCKEQLREMQTMTFYENVSFWDVLSGDDTSVVKYSENFDLVKAFFTTKCNGAFPNYCARMRYKIFDILSKNSLIDVATYVVCETIKRPMFYEIMQHEVMTYMDNYDFFKILFCCYDA